MKAKLLKKRTILLLLIIITALITVITAFLGYDYLWWLKSSAFFSITSIIAFYFGQISTAYKIKHVLDTKVDALVNDLAIPKLENLESPDLEKEAFSSFAEKLLNLFCKDFNYQGGALFLLKESLKPHFMHTYNYRSHQGLALKSSDKQLYYKLCKRTPNNSIYISKSSGSSWNIEHSSRKEHNEDIVLNSDNYTTNFPFIKLIPICLKDDDLLGYIALFKDRKLTFLDKVVDFIKLLSEEAILRDIENKKIDDAMENFLSRQLLLQVIVTFQYLDKIQNFLEKIKSPIELSTQIALAIRKYWNFNSCTIKLKTNELYCEADDSVDQEALKNKLMPKFVSEFNKDPYEKSLSIKSADIFASEPGFDDSFAVKIEKENNDYGILAVTSSKREITLFEKQVLVILENYKIDDCFMEFYMRQSLNPPKL